MFKIKYLRNILLISLGITLVFPLYNIFIAYPSFINTFTKDSEIEALDIAQHLMSVFISKETKLNEGFLPVDQKAIEEVKNHLNLIGLKIYSSHGKILYSTNPNDIGNINNNKYFYEIVAKGNPYSKTVRKDTKSLEEQVMTSDVVETYLPITEGNNFLGAFEIYYDITNKREKYERQILSASISQFIITLGFMALIISTLSKASKITYERKRISDVLEKERDRAQKYLDVVAVIIKVIDADQKVALMNKKGCEILGYKEEEIIGKNWFDIFKPEKGRDEAKAFFKKLIAGEINPPEYFESLVLTKSGEIRTLVWRFTLLKDDEGNVTGTLGSGIDVTEKREKEAEYKTIIETAMDGFWIVDTKGKFLDVNKAYTNLTGYSRDELQKMSVKDVEAIETEDEIAQHIQKVVETGYDRFERKHIRKNGSIVDVEISANYMGVDGGRFFVFLRDITERKKAEKEILLAKEEWENTFNTINDMIFICDKDLNIIKANKAAVDLLGMPREGTGKKVKCYEYFFHEKDSPIEKCPAIKHFITGEPVVHEMFVPRLNKVLEIRVIPRFENDQITGFINIARDVTVQRRIEEELIRTQKLSSLGKMMAGISHEIKNPLAGIGMILKALSYNYNERHSGYQDIMRVLNEINRLENLLDNFMKFSKPAPLILKEMDISLTLENSLNLLNNAIKDKEIKIKKGYHHNGLKIFIDPDRIQQVFINLILNAIEAIDKNVALKINIFEIKNGQIHRAETVYSDLNRHISESIDSGIKVVIKDSGHGIKKENLGKVFDPFYSSDENKPGLGLYVTHEIIRQHKGQIYVGSIEGFGTTFSIILPHSPEVYS
jgi:PAS domain S-box-containing protein